jgi:uncharacterized membrane protein
MYHVTANSPLLMAFWAAGAFITGYLLRSKASIHTAIVALLLGYLLQLGEWDVFSRGAEARGLAMAAWLPLGLLLFNVGAIHRRFQRTRLFASAYINLGVVTVYLGLIVFSFAEAWRALSGSSLDPPQRFWPSIWAYGSLCSLALLLGGFLTAIRGNLSVRIVRAIGLVTILMASLLVPLHPFGSADAYAIVFNLVLLGTVLWCIVLGIWSRQEGLITLSLVFFAFQILARYFDFFFSLFDRSLVFIGAGVVLLAGGWILERSRQVLLAHMHDDADEEMR